MSLLKSTKSIIPLMFTDSEIIAETGTDRVHIIEYPGIKFYSDWIDAAVGTDMDKMTGLAKTVLKDERGEPLLKGPDDTMEHFAAMHVYSLITAYMVKSKTKSSTPSIQAAQSND